MSDSPRPQRERIIIRTDDLPPDVRSLVLAVEDADVILLTCSASEQEARDALAAQCALFRASPPGVHEQLRGVFARDVQELLQRRASRRSSRVSA